METDDLEHLRDVIARMQAEVARVILGQEAAVNLALVAILANQHALIEGVPGIAKTLLVRVLAQLLGCDFGRIQFTPDLMPADIVGTSVFDLQAGNFRTVPGPVFTTFLLADEINRAPAKTQSALLQAMQERKVTIDRTTHDLSPDFTVFATQNPIEYEGTYPLPEAQKDRFMLKIPMGYPERAAERALADSMQGEESPEALLAHGVLQPLIAVETLPQLRVALRAVTLRTELIDYAVDLVRATRAADSVLAGAGPRATQAFVMGARAQAVIAGRDFVTPDDIRELAVPVLAHRILLRPEYEVEGLTPAELIGRLLAEVAVPR